MKIPNAERAVIAVEKLRDYLLNSHHRRGAAKAKLLQSLGYTPATHQRLDTDLRSQHLSRDVSCTAETPYGTRFEIAGPIRTPCGIEYQFRSIWQIDAGQSHPRLITMIPE